MSTRRFGWTVAATVSALIALGGGLVAVSLIGGMRVEVSMPEPRELVARAGQSIVLTANEQLTEVAAGDIRITPEVPFTVGTSANRVTIGLDEPLAYDTDYRIELNGISGAFSTRPLQVIRSFRTPAATVVMRDDDRGSARLVTMTVRADGTTGEHELFRSPALSGFALGDGVALVAVPSGSGSEIAKVDLFDGAETSPRVPVDGFVSQLSAEPDQALWGYRLTATMETADPASDGVLFVSRAGREPEPLSGLDGEPVHIKDWMFLPGKPALIALSTDDELTLFDLRPDRIPVPLGGFTSLVSAGRDGRSIVVGDDRGLLRYDLTTGTVTPLDFDADGEFVYPIDSIVLPTGELRLFSLVDASTHLFTQRVTFTAADGTPVTIDSETVGGILSAVQSTANGRYLAISSTHETTGATTTLVDLDTGTIIDTASGDSSVWVR